MLKYSIGLLVILLISTGILAKNLISTSADLQTANIELEEARMYEAKLAGKYEGQLLSLRRTIEARDARIAELSLVATETKDKTDEAIEANPDWAATRTPTAVRNRVCEYISCTDGGTEP